MIRFRKTALALVGAALIAAPALALAYGDGTPDEQPPAEEQVCDPAAGLKGAAYGLCVAYCEANDCETQPDKHACTVLLNNFERITGDSSVPCTVITIN